MAPATPMLPRFYLIVDDVRWIERLIPLGVKLVQLRAKDLPREALRQQLGQAQAICKRHEAQLILNDDWQLAIEAGCDFVHLGQEDLAAADVAAIRKAGIRLGVSTHDHEELERALAVDADYIALGPVYATKLKKMPWAPQGLERVSEWKRRVGARPLVGIGGLNIERAPGVLKAGADSLAVVTDVSLHANPEARVREWLRAVN